MRFRFPRTFVSNWTPLSEDGVGGASIRLFTSDVGTTSASSATRHRVGIQSYDNMVGATYGTYRDGPDPAPGGLIATGGTLSTDGQGFVELANGRFLLSGGAPAGHAYQVVNTIWYSDDRGKTWAILLPDAAPSSTRPAPAHTFGFFTWTIASVEYVYWVGGDPFTPTGDVFRSSDGGSTWTRISTTCPTSGLALFMYGVLNDVLYIIGGQVNINNGAASKTVHKSVDFGITWTTMSSGSNCPTDVWGDQLGPLPVKDNALWVCGSGRYDGTVNDFSNGVFKFDGTSWTEVLADGHGQFPASRYHSCVLDQTGKLWRFNGTTWDGTTLVGDTRIAHYSADGITWTALSSEITLTWQPTHAQAAIASTDGIFFTDGFESSNLNVLREHTGPLLSAWVDQGAGGLVLSQSTNLLKPILSANEFGADPGVVGSSAQVMTLAAPDRDIGGGAYEAWVVLKTLNVDVSSTQGPNPPGTLVGSVNGSSLNNFGLSGDSLNYHTGTPSTSTVEGGGLSTDRPRLVGVQHQASAVKLFIDGVQVGTTATTPGFDTTYTGWDSIFAGYLEDDKGAAVIAAIVVRKASTAWDSTKIAKLVTWASRWTA